MAGFMTVKRLRALIADPRLPDDYIALMHFNDRLYFAETATIAKGGAAACSIDFNAEEMLFPTSSYDRERMPNLHRPDDESPTSS